MIKNSHVIFVTVSDGFSSSAVIDFVLNVADSCLKISIAHKIIVWQSFVIKKSTRNFCYFFRWLQFLCRNWFYVLNVQDSC